MRVWLTNCYEQFHAVFINCQYNFIIENMFVAVAADELLPDSNWFIKIVQRKCVNNENVTDDYDHTIPAGFESLPRTSKNNKSSQIFKILSKFTYFCNESVVYLFININETDKGHILKIKT